MSLDPELLEILKVFRSESHELVDSIGQDLLVLEKATDPAAVRETASRMYRSAHNIKGAAASLDVVRVATLIHAVESVFGALRDQRIAPAAELIDNLLSSLDLVKASLDAAGPGDSELDADEASLVRAMKAVVEAAPLPAAPRPEPAAPKPEAAVGREDAHAPGDEELIRISQHKLTTLLEQIGELVEMKIRMEEVHLRVQGVDRELSRVKDVDLRLARRPLRQLARGIEQDNQYLGKLLDEIQDELKELRLVPSSTLFPVVRRAVREVCRKRDLDAELTLEGGDYELDRTIVQEIQAPLVHLVRNAVDHGLEPAAERKAAGKNPRGQIAVRVEHKGEGLTFEVSDDGRGVDLERVGRRAEQMGIVRQAAEMSTAELLKLLFVSGLSTTATADTISGRGVGLDVVKKSVEKLRGTIAVDTKQGKGTTFRISVPLTLATQTGLFVVVAETRFVIPSTAIQCVVSFSSKEIEVIQEVPQFWYQGRHIPLIRLDPMLQLQAFAPAAEKSRQVAVILSAAGSTAAFVVEGIEQEAQIVVRNTGSFLERLPNILGLTVTSTGEMIFVLNPAELVDSVLHLDQGQIGPAVLAKGDAQASGRRNRTILVVDDSVTTRILNQKLVASLGFDVVTASNGLLALETLRQRTCHLVLSDVDMPQLNGHELTRRIKADPILRKIPVVLLTALDRKEDREKGLQAGADGYLIKKSLSQEELLETILQFV